MLSSKGWHGTSEGIIRVPRGAGEADLLTLAPFARFAQSDPTGDSYTLSRASVAMAAARGSDPARLRSVLLHRCGTVPPDLEAMLTPTGGLHMRAGTVLLSDKPADLAVALRRRSVRRAVSVQLAPGVALVVPGQEAALARALARDGRAVTPPPPQTVPPAAELTPGEGAALLLAAAYYRASAPLEAPLGPPDELLARLRAGLPPGLGASTDAAIAALSTDDQLPSATHALTADDRTIADGRAAAEASPPLAALLDQLRATLRRRGTVTLRYQGAGEDAPRERIVRPLRLERHGPWWYLHAYCLLAGAERCFRLDRVLGLAAAAERPALSPARSPTRQARRPTPQRPRSGARVGFFAGPPDPPPGSPLIRVWLDEGSDQPVGRLAGDRADAVDGDVLDCFGVEPVAAHAVDLGVDQCEQLAPKGGPCRRLEMALEDAALYPRAVALEQLHDLGTALVLDDVVADEHEHRWGWLADGG